MKGFKKLSLKAKKLENTVLIFRIFCFDSGKKKFVIKEINKYWPNILITVQEMRNFLKGPNVMKMSKWVILIQI